VFGGDDACKVVEVLADEIAEGEHHPRAPRDRSLAPRGERRPCGGDGGVHVTGLGQQDLRLLLTGGRVPDRRGANRVPRRRASRDPVLDGRALHRAHWAVIFRCS
jgi:hypothetical protein